MSEPNGTEETKILRELDSLNRALKHLVDLLRMHQASLQALAEQVLTAEQLAAHDARAAVLYADLKELGQG
jgi:hypothetical protein